MATEISDTGNVSQMTPEEIAELEAMEAGEVVRDPATGAIIQDDGGFDFSEADAAGEDDDGYGVDDFLDDASDAVDTAGKVVDVVGDAADILDPPRESPPERRRSSGARNVSNEVEAEEEAPAEEEDAPPTVLGWPEWMAFDTAGNLYVLGFVIPWWGVLLALGAIYVVYEIIVFLFFSKKSKKKSWFF